MTYDLSILIPSRNEMFLARTIEDILQNIEANTEIIVVLDGYWPGPPLIQHERLNVIHLEKSIGQRAATNLACKLSSAKYVMKVDAHCAFDKGFDRKMLEVFEETGDNVTMVPIMRNLWAFDWKCLKCGKKWYQGPTPTKCQETNYKGTGVACDSTKFTKKIMWVGKKSPQSTSYCFDSTPHFQYFEEWKHREPYITDKKEKGLTETMSLQGSCFMLTREKYWELNICDEAFGGWGSQGIEVAAKTWLSGGRVLVNHKTWYAHMFRTQGGDFSFPYPMSGSQQRNAQKFARELFFNNKWDKQVRPLSWLLDKFWPVKGWTEDDLKKIKENTFEFKETQPQVKTEEFEPASIAEIPSNSIPQPKQESLTPDLSKSIIFLQDNNLPENIQTKVAKEIIKIGNEKKLPVINSTHSIINILKALNESESEIVFFCDSQVLYHPTHFDFTPKRRLAYYYNTNVWNLNLTDRNAYKVQDQKLLSGLCGYRTSLIRHYKKKLELINKKNDDEFTKSMDYEPGTVKGKRAVDNYKLRTFGSVYPNIVIQNDYNPDINNEVVELATIDTIPGWSELVNILDFKKSLTKGIIIYTDQVANLKVSAITQQYINKISEEKGMEVLTDDEDIAAIYPDQALMSMYQHITKCLEQSNADIIYLCDRNILYHSAHFEFTPSARNTLYYNLNVNSFNSERYPLSGLSGFREDLLSYFNKLLEQLTQVTDPDQTNFKFVTWRSESPNQNIQTQRLV